MNGAKKFHKPESPAFNEGETWVGSSGGKVTIHKVVRYGVDKWDADIYYWSPMDERRSVECHKNAWSFQVRYQHQADLEI
ncbi:hypothetical protein QGX21_gp096 [Pseudomonas phage phiPsa315]|uniref:Uncharacterized protein n=1 Tax=Pseudomonas phage phiPsa315 TaxID=1460363 RepID=A0A7G9V217_9CAUD|nr:hypothetical protein QGX21_gp096 [Pseudomonas phage phiPsa315]QNO00323.1 hypothetical protein phiPsa315_130 [Pseudomonas phage phiPsa315]